MPRYLIYSLDSKVGHSFFSSSSKHVFRFIIRLFLLRMKDYKAGFTNVKSYLIRCRPVVEFAQFRTDYCFKNFQIFFSKKYIGIISEEIKLKFSRALVDIINIQQKQTRA